MRNVLFLSFHGFSEYNGISKKIHSQVCGLIDSGIDTIMCYYDVDMYGHRKWMSNEDVIIDFGTGILAKLKKRFCYKPLFHHILQQQITFVYIRSDHNANPFSIHFVTQLRNRGIKVVMEIPTYPYDQEYSTFKGKCSLFIDKLFRKRLAKQLNAIVTFSNEPEIFGQHTIRISNGIDFDLIKLKQCHNQQSEEIHLIGVAEIHFWHGFDRIIAGLANYYKSDHYDGCKVYFHIIGEFSGERERTEILPLIMKNQLENYVILYGQLFGTTLDEVFDRADIGVGSLGRHRSGITYIKTLKNREYAARGIPFIYSEIDEDFERMPYILKVPADESPVDIRQIIDFYHRMMITPEEIRNSVGYLSWRNQMQKVIDAMDIA